MSPYAHTTTSRDTLPMNPHHHGQAIPIPATIKTNTTIPDAHVMSMLNNVIAIRPGTAQFHDWQPCSIS
ncbi:hypothetical protein IMZ11_41280 [Microtetraspora sp. AC03309]|uniref:hypothetical protein n=1 Tax=Microtetraspora sp. AC03309 TaxID=2779376 RepID=UPI001E5C6323|nr:hypothetical protein [Microtetraspora sp. AC03309]MCC5582051.1 hypothetical protein [Microtetraspora sp. AC03309]